MKLRTLFVLPPLFGLASPVLAGSGDDFMARYTAAAKAAADRIKTMPEGPEKKAAAKEASVGLQQMMVDDMRADYAKCPELQAKFHDPNDPVMQTSRGKVLAANLDAQCADEATMLKAGEAKLEQMKAETP